MRGTVPAPELCTPDSASLQLTGFLGQRIQLFLNVWWTWFMAFVLPALYILHPENPTAASSTVQPGK